MNDLRYEGKSIDHVVKMEIYLIIQYLTTKPTKKLKKKRKQNKTYS